MKFSKSIFRLLISLAIVSCVGLWTTDTYARLPFVVRVIYFQPTDALDAPAFIATHIKAAQQFYKDEMARNGFEPKTFRLETDNSGKVIVHTIKGKNKSWEYANNTTDRIMLELPANLKQPNNIYVFFVGKLLTVKGFAGYGYALYGGVCGGRAVIAAGERMPLSVVIHELGHTFGLYHNIVDTKAVMGPGNKSLSVFETRWLDKHHYFNDVHKINDVPKVTKVYRPRASKNQNTQMVVLKVDVESQIELHQVQLVRDRGTALVGWSEVTDKFDSAEITVKRSLLADVNNVYFIVLDGQGNFWMHKAPLLLPNRIVDRLKDSEPEKEDQKSLKDNEPRALTADKKLTIVWAKLKGELF